MDRILKQEGFLHERLIVLPKAIIENSRKNPIISSLYITDIGYFPQAKNHYRHRKDGSENHIFIFCVQGKGHINIDGSTYTLKKNEFCFIPSETPHTYFADQAEPWSIYWFHFNGTLSLPYMNLMEKDSFVKSITYSQHSEFIRRFNQCYQCLEKGFGIEKRITITNLLGLAFSSLYLQQENDDQDMDLPQPVNACIDYMLDNIRSKLDLRTMSKVMNLSKSHLIHLFREQTGFTPIDYFIHLKTQKACTMLDTTRLSVKEISAYLGYDDPLYFSRVFKKVMGSSPKHYREILKG